MDSVSLTIRSAGAALRSGALTCAGLTATLLDRISQIDPALNAFITVMGDDAMKQAFALDAELAAGIDRGPLHGIPIAVKDLFDIAGVRSTAGSRFLATSAVKAKDARVVQSLRKAGAVFLGKNNMAEFAAGMISHNSTYGDMHNPWNVDYSAGGSSGGTAIAVASGMSLGGVGSDTGGSVRFPASVCGVVGIRPTKGLVSLDGTIPRSMSLDAASPIARTVDDAALLLAAMVGQHRSGASPIPSSGKAADHNLCGLRVGLINEFTFTDVNPAIEIAVQRAVDALSDAGAQICPVEIPVLSSSLDHQILFNLLLYEFYQVLGEDYRTTEDTSIFGPVVRDDLERGARVTRSEYDAALAAKSVIVSETQKVFGTVDVLLTPTQPMETPRFAAGIEAFANARRFLLPTSFIGWPSISVPCGFSSAKLPVGVQIIGNYFQEQLIFDVARVIEGTIWHRREFDIRSRLATLSVNR